MLPFKAAIIYNFGGPQPVAHTKFYLLARDFDRVLSEKGSIRNRKGALIEPFVASLASDGSRIGLIEEGFRSDTVATTMTDFEGSSRISRLENISSSGSPPPAKKTNSYCGTFP